MASFDDNALSKLTEKIDQKLSESKKAPKKKQSQQNLKSPQSKQDKPDLKRKRQDDKAEPAAKKRNDQPKKDFKDKIANKKNSKSNKKGPKPAQNGAENGASSSNTLLDEIRALGGDEKDLDLIGDVDSDDENIGGGGLDKALQAELAKFASGLGFEKVQPEEADEEEEEEVEEAEQDGEDEDWEEASEEEQQQVPAKKAKAEKPTAQPIPKGDWKTIFEPRPDWHAVELTRLPEPNLDDDVGQYFSAIAGLKAYAKRVLEEDSATHSTSQASSSSRKFMSEIMSSGTMSDKTSALTLAIQESPVHSIKALENLIGLATKRSRGQALAAAAALVDLLGPGSLLPSDRRLRTFGTQPGLIGTLQKHHIKTWTDKQGLPGVINKAHLVAWAFEDWLKEAYFRIIQAIEVWCSDEIEYSRVRSIDMVYALLKDKPEQESNLLRLLVNKLGDREKKIASRASYLLLQLLNIHPGMKAIMIKTIEQEVVFRPGQNIRTRYYATNTLNQTILSSKEPQIADALLKIYFGMFVALLKSGDLGDVEKFEATEKPDPKTKTFKKQKRSRAPGPSKKEKEEEKATQAEKESAEKLVSAILTGINRAVPFSETDSSTLESHLDTLFRITHSSNFNTSIQALMLIQQMATTRHLATDRFYRTLYESLLDPRLMNSSKQALYLNLLYRSLKSDVDLRRVKAFVKRMLQILNLHQPSFVCGIMYLIMELWATFPDLSTLLNEPEEHDESEGNGNADGLDDAPKPTDAYDGRKRVPEYSNAHRSCLWELVPYLRHFHPTVDIYATSLLNGKKPAQKPDLASHTLINFLDKFVYKNAKATDTTRGASLMQPVTAAGQGSVLVSGKPGKTSGNLNSADFWNKKVQDVAAEDVFFHEYFNRVGKPAQAEKAKKKAKADDSDDEELGAAGSDAGEDEIWEALKASRPEVQEDDEDSELGSDFEELMGDDSDDDAGLDQDAMDVDGESDGGLDFSDASSLDFSSDEDEEGGAPAAKEDDGKPKSAARERKKMLRGLPTFASVDDYAQMLAEEEDGL
ncbi:CBF/Mak21 family-domain-containing protein [Pestalotiopsis sp. NC0098]|nr:CBF/Mak21 family-domain-containing protein [Pestalotiopsis sp. NC0098]